MPFSATMLKYKGCLSERKLSTQKSKSHPITEIVDLLYAKILCISKHGVRQKQYLNDKNNISRLHF